jgi:pyridoxine 5-phosphate synthase
MVDILRAYTLALRIITQIVQATPQNDVFVFFKIILVLQSEGAKSASLLHTEFNIEGYPSKEFIELVLQVKPAQVTLVPDAPDQITSNHGWDTVAHQEFLTEVVSTFKAAGIRTSVFVDPDAVMVEHAAKVGADRVELYTEPYAANYAKNREAAIAPYIVAAKAAKKNGLGLNAGHDLSLDNLAYFAQSIPNLDEVSIGHALICDALYLGIEETIRRYKECLKSR